MFLVMGKTGRPLKTKETPNGILNLELAYSPQKATAVLAAWTKNEIQPVDIITAAKNNTWWDFIFIFFYGSFLCTACLTIAEVFQYNNYIHRTGRFLARLIIVAAILDVMENIGMFQELNGNTSEFITCFTSTCSIFKWLMVITVILFVIITGVYALMISKRKKAQLL